jgi:hypothetical protein
MAKPYIHAKSSAKKFGGVPDDYMDIHEFMDSSKGSISDNRHRALTHNSWFIMFVLPRVFGDTRENSAGRVYSIRDIGEQHVLEDFAHKFIPTAQDYLAEMDFQDWMDNGKGVPPSFKKVYEKSNGKSRKFIVID